jgi:hypothetical protein
LFHWIFCQIRPLCQRSCASGHILRAKRTTFSLTPIPHGLTVTQFLFQYTRQFPRPMPILREQFFSLAVFSLPQRPGSISEKPDYSVMTDRPQVWLFFKSGQKLYLDLKDFCASFSFRFIVLKLISGIAAVMVCTSSLKGLIGSRTCGCDEFPTRKRTTS